MTPTAIDQPADDARGTHDFAVHQQEYGRSDPDKHATGEPHYPI
jgi:hypothetical protein